MSDQSALDLRQDVISDLRHQIEVIKRGEQLQHRWGVKNFVRMQRIRDRATALERLLREVFEHSSVYPPRAQWFEETKEILSQADDRQDAGGRHEQ